MRRSRAVTSVLLGSATSSLTMLHLTPFAVLRRSQILYGLKMAFDSTAVDTPATGLVMLWHGMTLRAMRIYYGGANRMLSCVSWKIHNYVVSPPRQS
eukprot:4057724-Pyramimonas_sp.AAC.1